MKQSKDKRFKMFDDLEVGHAYRPVYRSGDFAAIAEEVGVKTHVAGCHIWSSGVAFCDPEDKEVCDLGPASITFLNGKMQVNLLKGDK